jgi:hypothetical protein
MDPGQVIKDPQELPRPNGITNGGCWKRTLLALRAIEIQTEVCRQKARYAPARLPAIPAGSQSS